MTDELALLQAARFKGRLSPDLAAACCGVDLDTATADLADLREAGLVAGEGAVRLTQEGRGRLADLAAAERATVDHAGLAALYDEFDRCNADFKQIVTDWQLRDGAPNDHVDTTYDGAVLDRLATLHAGFGPLIDRIGAVAPRLRGYAQRFATAMARVQSGDTTFVARPITDSYHTVWFELHEELIGLLGLSREHESDAGRAQ